MGDAGSFHVVELVGETADRTGRHCNMQETAQRHRASCCSAEGGLVTFKGVVHNQRTHFVR